MNLFLLLLYLTAFLLRPEEQFPILAPFRLMFILGIIAIVGSVLAILNGKRLPLRKTPVLLMIGLLIFAILSEVGHGWFGGGLYVLDDFGVTTAVFLMTLLAAASLRDVRIIAGFLVVVSVVMALQGVLAFHTGYGGENVFANKFLMNQTINRHAEAIAADDLHLTSGQMLLPFGSYVLLLLVRIRSVGFLSDPNDFGQFLLLSMPFLALAWRRRAVLRNLLLVCVPLALILYAIFLTRSRGALVGLLVITLLGFKDRLGPSRAVILSAVLALGLLAFGFSGGRDDVDDESAQGRVSAWSDGLQKLKSNPIIGVGYKEFTNEGDLLTAHNSFVLCFSELGISGYFVWLALLATVILPLRSLARLPVETIQDLDFRRWAKAILLSLYSFLITSLFLSRTWDATLYIILALGAGLVNVALYAAKPVEDFPVVRVASRVFALELASIAAVYMLVKVHVI